MGRARTGLLRVGCSSFPPLNTLQLSELRLLVDVFSAAPQARRYGPFSSTSATRAYGEAGYVQPAAVGSLTRIRAVALRRQTPGHRHLQEHCTRPGFIPKVTSDHPTDRCGVGIEVFAHEFQIAERRSHEDSSRIFLRLRHASWGCPARNTATPPTRSGSYRHTGCRRRR